ncbi:hypothetical protein C8R42DRAFT_613654, partial [Lentinula raphanica]
MFSGASHFDIRDSSFNIHLPSETSPNAPTIPSTLNTYPPTERSPHAPSIPLTSAPNAHTLNRTSLPFVESQIYAQSLLLRRKGYPLWEPKSHNARLPGIYKEKGVHIGDIGILTDSGGFDYLFNVCHEATHPLNVGRVPDDFKPITGIADDDIDEGVTTYDMCHISSNINHIYPSQMHRPRAPVNQFEGLSKKFGKGLSFQSTISEGALLILPEDGKHVDHRQLATFANYATDNAIMWYQHIGGPLG